MECMTPNMWHISWVITFTLRNSTSSRLAPSIYLQKLKTPVFREAKPNTKFQSSLGYKSSIVIPTKQIASLGICDFRLVTISSELHSLYPLIPDAALDVSNSSAGRTAIVAG